MYLEEMRQQIHGIDHTEGVGELGTEAAHGVDDEVLVGDGMTDVGESICQLLETAAEFTDGEITLL